MLTLPIIIIVNMNNPQTPTPIPPSTLSHATLLKQQEISLSAKAKLQKMESM